jgi:diaminobutyrate-2-oxoglutarate transaminase
MKKRLDLLAKSESSIKQVRGRGMIYGVEMGTENCKKVTKECFDNGMVISPCGPALNVMKLIPPLTIEPETLDEGLKIFEAAVASVGAN